MFVRLAMAMSLIAFSTTSISQQSVHDPLSSFYVTDLNVMPEVAEHFEVAEKVADGFEIVVPESKRELFSKIAPDAILLVENFEAQQFQGQNLFANGYRNFETLQTEMAELALAYPDLVQVVKYGVSQQGLPLIALKISDNVDLDEDEPELMLTAATHGDELITTEVLMNLIEQMLNGYSVDERFAAMINDHEMYFIPVVNPDGYTRQWRYDNNVDPNRSYPYPGSPNRQPSASIKGLLDLFHSRDFVGSIDFHAFGRMVMYPWAYTYDSIEEEDRLAMDAITQSMAETNGYVYGPISKVIYVAKGSSADYYYWKNKTYAIAIELGTSKAPPASQIATYTQGQAESLWRFIEAF